MSRPHKTGLSYFPMDVDTDDKIECLEARHGIEGFGVLIKIFQKIYKENGYWYPWTDREQLLLSKRVNVDINSVRAIINSCVDFDIFDKEQFKKGILTSRGIQKRYTMAAERRKDFAILDIYRVNVDNNPVNVCNNPPASVVNVDGSTHIKLNKSKLNKSKVKNIETPLSPLMIEEPRRAATAPPVKGLVKASSLPATPEKILENAIYADCLAVNGNQFTNYPKERKGAKELARLCFLRCPDDPRAFATEIGITFNALKASGDKFWKGQPFLPSVLATPGIFDRIIEAGRSEQKAAESDDWIADTLKQVLAAKVEQS